MRVVIAPDSFKECLSAKMVAESIAAGVLKALPEAKIRKIPMADGGEGTVEALVAATGGRIMELETLDPLMRPIVADCGILGNDEVVVMEMASASGLALVEPDKRNPMNTSTFGTGLMIKEVMELGYKKIILGIGGSATNDGGAGMARALGFRLPDADGVDIGEGGGSLKKLAKIDRSFVNAKLSGLEINVACDVDNPMLGPTGASAVYGPQKGADKAMVDTLDAGLAHFAEVIRRDLQKDIAGIPGTGAAGGLGGGLLAFTNARLRPGFDIISEFTGLEDAIAQCDLVFTAEGRIDHQTQFGKTPAGVGKIAKRYNKPVIALAGTVGHGTHTLHAAGISAIFSIADGPISLEDSIARAPSLLQDRAEQVVRLFLAGAGFSMNI